MQFSQENATMQNMSLGLHMSLTITLLHTFNRSNILMWAKPAAPPPPKFLKPYRSEMLLYIHQFVLKRITGMKGQWKLSLSIKITSMNQNICRIFTTCQIRWYSVCRLFTKDNTHTRFAGIKKVFIDHCSFKDQLAVILHSECLMSA